jgi:hypothetical protein
MTNNMTPTKECIRHTFRLVNNRYDEKGEHVIEGGKWVTEKVCEKCGEKLAVTNNPNE